MDQLTNPQLWAIIGPVVALQLLLMIIALVACVRAEETRGPRWMWVLIIIFGNLIGSILFFIFGRKGMS
ncbi:PLD nuclease N-terminal domain-containing protein [Paenibacillus spongiae]|uniref:PLD nuclease N-terminal domain-containing protein n=1 Tax=Paenibacillus spongiae TaxID=2909671 RepID=A0ABY5SBK6_9BACL|nr:PLD nuclease N-terminal domain-containing protein [Paenibacillus spongiae]UVI31329.1 PLD nuclease N-terminal domain-containing protein [Paenibacillus spongiae]